MFDLGSKGLIRPVLGHGVQHIKPVTKRKAVACVFNYCEACAKALRKASRAGERYNLVGPAMYEV